MKRKEVSDTIAHVGAKTFLVDGSLTLFNPKTDEKIAVDMPSTLAIVRGTLVWVDSLLEDGATRELSTTKNLQKLLTFVGYSLAHEIAGDEGR